MRRALLPTLQPWPKAEAGSSFFSSPPDALRTFFSGGPSEVAAARFFWAPDDIFLCSFPGVIFLGILPGVSMGSTWGLDDPEAD